MESRFQLEPTFFQFLYSIKDSHDTVPHAAETLASETRPWYLASWRMVPYHNHGSLNVNLDFLHTVFTTPDLDTAWHMQLCLCQCHHAQQAHQPLRCMSLCIFDKRWLWQVSLRLAPPSLFSGFLSYVPLNVIRIRLKATSNQWLRLYRKLIPGNDINTAHTRLPHRLCLGLFDQQFKERSSEPSTVNNNMLQAEWIFDKR